MNIWTYQFQGMYFTFLRKYFPIYSPEQPNWLPRCKAIV